MRTACVCRETYSASHKSTIRYRIDSSEYKYGFSDDELPKDLRGLYDEADF
jgi:hypothetical protein